MAEGIGRSRRTLERYMEGTRAVTADAARQLVKYLRGRAQKLGEAADELEAAVEREEKNE